MFNLNSFLFKNRFANYEVFLNIMAIFSVNMRNVKFLIVCFNLSHKHVKGSQASWVLKNTNLRHTCITICLRVSAPKLSDSKCDTVC